MQFPSKRREQGSVLAVTLIACLVIATALASYLVLISNRYKMTVRSMDWNAAIPILEAGVEEALTHLVCDTNAPAANGWTADTVAGQAVVKKQRDFADGSYATVWIVDAGATNPTIYSQGFVPAPLEQGYISRTVKVTTERPTVFSAAIAANERITLSGSNSIVDSYRSCDGLYSTNGNGLGTNGAIATNLKTAGAIKVGTANVYGTVTTGPGGTVTYTDPGGVGDAAWHAGNSGIQTGWKYHDMNVAFPANQAPTGGPFPAPPVDIDGATNTTVLATGTYQLTSFSSLHYTKPMVVSGKAILYVSGNLAVQSSGYIRILPGASLTVYVGGTGTIGGTGVINEDSNPANFTYYGLPTSGTLSISGDAAFYGTINAPQATMTVSGTAEVYGAAIVKSYIASGSGGFHYDECLGKPGTYLTMTGWEEL